MKPMTRGLLRFVFWSLPVSFVCFVIAIILLNTVDAPSIVKHIVAGWIGIVMGLASPLEVGK